MPFEKSEDDLILCNHYKGVVHYGCCIDRCSQDRKPCEHCLGHYRKRNDFKVAW